MADTDKHDPASMGHDKTERPKAPGGAESSDSENTASQWAGSGSIHDSSELDDDRVQPAPAADDAAGLSIGEDVTQRVDAQRERWRVGDLLLDRYEITGELGQGGMGVVFRCFDRVGGIDVAVKALPPEVSHSAEDMEEIRENFRIVAGLAHPGIAGIRTLEQDAE